MERVPSSCRPDWEAENAEQGFHYYSGYWVEDAYYAVSRREATTLADAAITVTSMLERAVTTVMNDANRYRQLLTAEGIPFFMADTLQSSRSAYPSGGLTRVRLGWNPEEGFPVVLRCSAGLPLGMVEQAAQQKWASVKYPDGSQFANLDNALTRMMKRYEKVRVHALFPLVDETGEDVSSLVYWVERALDAGVEVKATIGETLTIRYEDERVLDHDDELVETMYVPARLRDVLAGNPEFRQALIQNHDLVSFVEPLWRDLISSAYAMAAAWALNLHHPNLLETRIGNPGDMGEEDAIVYPLSPIMASMPTVQRRTPYKDFNAFAPVFDVWLVDGEPSALMVQEYPVGDSRPKVVPHLIVD